VGGYHKAAAGIGVTLPNVKKLPTGERVLNEEVLNPQGINVVKKHRSGNFILWGDRTIALDSGWKWKHQRETMSHYENILLEEMDFIIFAINDPETQGTAITTLRQFFLPEFNKRALRGVTFDKAVQIKIDDENNNDLTRANGDLNAEITLRLADTVERFIIRIGKAGIFDDIS
jgi:phage tail sheath protein FI